MTGIRQAAGDYLAVRRALGYKLEDHGWLLADFASFLEAAGAAAVTTRLALDWATLPEDALPSWHAARLRVVRGFARHLQALDPATEVPPPGLLAGRNRRAVPYLYSDAEVAALMAATASLRPALHAATHKTLIGLLSTTGMRLGEAIRLDRADLDAAAGTLTIRDSKFAKSRQIPLHPSALAALADYAQLRDQRFPEPKTPALLVSTAGTRLISQGIHYVFARLVRQAGLAPRSPDCRPRLHDFRHSLAVNQLLAWYRQGADVQARLPLLSTLLGHSQPANTYWYLSAVPELLALAAERRQTGLRARS
ncbi:MAG TPA: tyrosine-type recombinase/integrase [Streptosporangiaceae bacterium]